MGLPVQDRNSMDMRNQILDSINLVEYQEGSVVSRTLLDKKTGTITLFAFTEGEGLSEHTAPFDAFVYIIDGKANIYIDGKEHIVEKGKFIIMPKDLPHLLRAIEKFKMMLVMIR